MLPSISKSWQLRLGTALVFLNSGLYLLAISKERTPYKKLHKLEVLVELFQKRAGFGAAPQTCPNPVRSAGEGAKTVQWTVFAGRTLAGGSPHVALSGISFVQINSTPNLFRRPFYGFGGQYAFSQSRNQPLF